MKLYYLQGACSLAAHISLREAQMPFTLVRYHRAGQVVDGGESFEEVNAKGYVPVLELDNCERLTEAAAVLQYIADQRPNSQRAPPFGSVKRDRSQLWL